MATRHASARVDPEAGGVDDRLGLVGIDRADRVDDRAASADSLGGSAEQLELKLRKWLGPPAQVRAPIENAKPGARRIDERSVEAVQLERKRTPVGDDDMHVRRTQALGGFLELSRAAFVDVDRRDVAVEHRRLAARRGADIEGPLVLARPDREPHELGGGALRPDPAVGESFGVDPVDAPRTGNGRIGRAARPLLGRVGPRWAPPRSARA